MESSRRELFTESNENNDAASAWFDDNYQVSVSSNTSSNTSLASSTDVSSNTSLASSTDVRSNRSLSNSSNTSHISLNTFANFFPPVKVNCELENTFAELAKFTEEKLYKMGNYCPTNSPMSSPIKEKHPSRKDVLARLPLAQSEIITKYDNNCFVKIHNDSNRNYNRLMTAAKSFNKRIQAMDPHAFEKYIDTNDIQCMERTIINLRKLPAIHFIAFLYLADKYPMVADQTFILLYMTFQKKLDIYEKFNELDSLLKKTTLTKTAMEAHLMIQEGVEKFGIKL